MTLHQAVRLLYSENLTIQSGGICIKIINFFPARRTKITVELMVESLTVEKFKTLKPRLILAFANNLGVSPTLVEMEVLNTLRVKRGLIPPIAIVASVTTDNDMTVKQLVDSMNQKSFVSKLNKNLDDAGVSVIAIQVTSMEALTGNVKLINLFMPIQYYIYIYIYI